jgi:glycosyltransferase involved in cell wall biosynthesis
MSGIKMQQNKCPKVTVVTVTYNAEQYLEQTIKSVIEQDYPNIEYIIIDGASTDGTVNIIKQYEKYITYWISEPDEGIYDAMNKGIDAATGEWINFMNAGDSFTNSNILSQFIKKVEPNKTIVCGAINVVNDDNEILFSYTPKISKNLLEKCFCNHQATFVKTKLLKKNPFNLHYKYAADYDFLINIGKKYNNFQILNFTVTDYLNNGLWEQNKTKALIECLNIIAIKH